MFMAGRQLELNFRVEGDQKQGFYFVWPICDYDSIDQILRIMVKNEFAYQDTNTLKSLSELLDCANFVVYSLVIHMTMHLKVDSHVFESIC